MTAIAGESGSGKTTLARLLLGFIDRRPRGEVLYRGKDLATHDAAPSSASSGARCSRSSRIPFEVFNPFYRVDHVLTTPVKRFKLGRHAQAEARALIEEALERVGLRPARDARPLSRTSCAAASASGSWSRARCCCGPRIIVADEPVSMVDASLRATILDELRTLNRELGISILYITHDLTTAFQICDNILILYRGDGRRGRVGRARDRRAEAPLHAAPRVLDPAPRPLAAWGTLDVPVREASGAMAAGCNFAPRCPHVMDICRASPPPRFLPDSERLARCFLYRGRPIAADEDVASVFRLPGRADPVEAARTDFSRQKAGSRE